MRGSIYAKYSLLLNQYAIYGYYYKNIFGGVLMEKIDQIEKAIDLIAEKFINSIRGRIRHRNTYPHNCHYNFDILGIANEDYYEYKHMEREMSSIVREDLINKCSKILFYFYGKQFKCIPPEKNHLYFPDAFSYEDRFSGEFIIDNLLVRYTPLFRNDVRLIKILPKHNIKKIYIIDWTKENCYRDEKRCSIPELNKYIEVNLSLKSFFIEFFSAEIYDLFINKVKKAIKTANEEIGFQTISNLSLHHLSDFRKKRLEFFKALDYMALEYKYEIGNNTTYGITQEDSNKIYNNYINNRLYNLLICNTDFSKCFITSEYLYSIFKSDDKIDYTSIVSGYLKSIEQLINQLMKICLNCTTDKLWITRKSGLSKKSKDTKIYLNNNSRENPNNKGHYQISFTHDSERYFDTSLGSLIWFLHDYRSLWCLSEQSFEYLLGKNGILQKYKQECRNEHFHKDNIYDHNKVERIRNNTILLFFLLLGSINNQNIINELCKLYADKYTVFDNLCSKLMELPRSQIFFYITFEDGVEMKAIRLIEQDEPSYDENGSLKDMNILFSRVESFDIPDEDTFKRILNSKERRITIDKDHIPHKISFAERNGKRFEII